MSERTEMHPDAFVAAARRVVEAKGEPFLDGLRYRDEVIEIVLRGGDLDVTRKPVEDPDRPHLAVGNPVTMVRGGRLIRHHGEAHHLHGHLAALDGA